ncbi:helix-turn-helix domain-containing protein [Microbacterium sp. ISL-108]|nr:helix-turn-helix domain-containing protein [Microbacterium sp. ISL-108]
MRRGKTETATTFVGAMKKLPTRDTLLPFTRWPEVQELVLADDDSAAAAALLWDDAADLWSRGGRLSALLSQIAAVGLNPRRDWLDALRSRVDLIDSPLLQAQADSVEMLREQDADVRDIAVPRLHLIGDEPAGADAHDLFEFRQVRPRLSDREVEVARLIAQGLSNQQIAQRLTLSPRTVENHVHRALRKTGGTRRADLMVVVQDDGVR